MLYANLFTVPILKVLVRNDGSFELSYLAENGPKSIIGQVSVNGDQTMTWEFAPTVQAECKKLLYNSVKCKC